MSVFLLQKGKSVPGPKLVFFILYDGLILKFAKIIYFNSYWEVYVEL